MRELKAGGIRLATTGPSTYVGRWSEGEVECQADLRLYPWRGRLDVRVTGGRRRSGVDAPMMKKTVLGYLQQPPGLACWRWTAQGEGGTKMDRDRAVFCVLARHVGAATGRRPPSGMPLPPGR